MNRFHLTRLARRDINSIWEYVSQSASPQMADRVVSAIYDAIQLLVEFPGAGHERSDVKNPKYRFWEVYQYIIAYRIDRKPLTVGRIVHGSRNLKRLFR